MIEVRNLSFSFDNNKFFDNVSFNLPENKINVIVGPNGAGKTTLLKLLAKAFLPDKGFIGLNNLTTFYLPQRINYISGITLYEYLASIFFRNSWKWFLENSEKEQINNILNCLEIFDKKDILIENLSAGELQKANIGLGLLSGARLFLLDEPTSNMDLINQVKTLNIIKKLTMENVTSLIILHDLNLASCYGDYFIGIDKTRKIFCADKLNFFDEQDLKNIYNMPFKVIKNKEDIHVQILN